MKKYVVCPPCGTVFEEETEEELVRVTQAHSTENHRYTPPPDEVRNAMTSTPPIQKHH
ncbi:MAG TPA: DUF1059 domain-containing protein [Candidatus Baltobacteraceae bacterium]|jgi:hypothetical protein